MLEGTSHLRYPKKNMERAVVIREAKVILHAGDLGISVDSCVNVLINKHRDDAYSQCWFVQRGSIHDPKHRHQEHVDLP